jgi:ABC-2 type transport system ATP-binding protein
LGFLGPNGAGKSTTMKIATCFVTPTEGTVEVCGFDVQQNPIEVRKQIGYLPEHNPLYLEMFVHEYLLFSASLHGITGKKAKERVAEIVELVGLTKEQNKLIGALSKGYRQRVGLAQALIHDPKVLILDEPTTGLDPNQISEIRQVIRQISRDKTVIFSTHIMQEVQALCDRVIIIRDGEIVANDVIERLDQKVEVTVRVEFQEEISDASKFSQIEDFTRFEKLENNSYLLFAMERDIRADIFKMAVENDWVILGMSQEKASLEGIFKELTTR